MPDRLQRRYRLRYRTGRQPEIHGVWKGGSILATLRGTGTVYLQSLPFSRLANRVLQAASFGRSKGEGSVLGGIGDMYGDSRPLLPKV